MSCCDAPGLMPVEQALARILTDVKAVQEVEQVNLFDALGLVVAEDIYSEIAVPAFDNSAMDGYALAIESLQLMPKNVPYLLPVSQRIKAGDPANKPLAIGTCARIFTGAKVPPNANVVIMQEQCQLAADNLVLFADDAADKTVQGQHIRPAGQDISQGACIIKAGKKLRPQELGLIASVGIASVPVYRKLTVAVISTGNEIVHPGMRLSEGQIYNSNHFTLVGLLKANHFDVFDCGVIKDNPQQVEAALVCAAKYADCIITSGGVSVGEEDYVKASIEKLGHLDLWKIAIKPGKPFAFGYINDTPFIGLPGNPSAVLATFTIIAKTYLNALQGQQVDPHKFNKAKANFKLTKSSPREQYLYVKANDAEGELWLEKFPNQSSGVLSSASWANGFAKIPANQQVAIGDELAYISI